jgi:hypothetical protein
MAIDTVRKRKSIAALGLPWMGCVVHPDGTLNAFDRAAIGYTYAGIALTGGIAGAIDVIVRLMPSLAIDVRTVPSLDVAVTFTRSLDKD